jgi:hypothetical protein
VLDGSADGATMRWNGACGPRCAVYRGVRNASIAPCAAISAAKTVRRFSDGLMCRC